MNLRDIMVENVIVSRSDISILKAMELMKVNRIRHLPIQDNDEKLIGIVSDRDLRDASPSVFDELHKEFVNLPVSKIMVTDVITAMPMDFVEEAANMMIENRISCLPVEENGKLIGIITETDLLNTLVRLTGADLPTSRLEIEVNNESGQLSEASNIIRKHQINIQSVLVYPSFQDKDRKILVFRLQCMDMRALLNALKQNNYRIIWPTDMEMKA